ncbi:MAG: protein kinase [bacterium]|nr:protein kinase [bacterium]
MGKREDERSTETLTYGQRARKPTPLAETMAASASPAAPVGATLLSGVRSTVLPRLERRGAAQRVVVDGKARYEPLRPLGAGGQAEVTLARDHDIDRAVALKRLLPGRSDEASVLRFAEEIRAVGQLEHPNIVPIHDVGVDEEGRYFFVMKYVEGETLAEIIERLRAGDEACLRRYTPEYRLQICNEILRGVEHAHALGIVHRDLKPANVMVGALGEVVIMDWGLAKRIGEAEPGAVAAAASGDERARLFQTQVGALLGTPAYMAPEQAEGRLDAIDARSDVYSLAVMFYEFLCLRHPRQQLTTVAEMIAAIVAEPIGKGQLLADFGRAGAPAAAAHFVRHGLAREPEQRYPSVAAMRQRLEAVRDGRAPIECHVTFTQRVLSMSGRGANRHPWILLASLLAIVIAVVVGAVKLVAMARG